jgi:DNA polymerase I-like protein with 3'-5' exonuclease and polymerase domains
MKILYLDFETADKKIYKNGKIKHRSPSPYHPDNFLVSYGFRTVGYDSYTNGYRFIKHNEFTGSSKDACVLLQKLLDECELLVAFNAKFELQWLLEAGFKYNGPVRCPMVIEYILARGVKRPLSLASLCDFYQTTTRKSSITDEYWQAGLSFHEIPIDVVREYGELDVQALYEVDQAQQAVLKLDENKVLEPTIAMSLEFIWCLVEMERNGIAIDSDALSRVKEQYETEYNQLKKDLEEIAQSVMGDTPINLDSPEQLSWVIYSRKVKDKKEWARTFNIGLNKRGKKLSRPRFSTKEFRDAVRLHSEVIRRTEAAHCTTCNGSRMANKVRADGQPFKRPGKCSDCQGRGYLLLDTGKVAGLKVNAANADECSSGGFETSKKQVAKLLGRVSSGSTAMVFLSKLVRYNAVGTYLETFVGGIERGVGEDGLLHTQLLQAITSTGRLSSRDPNFQNMPRARTFPVRRVVTSRWAVGEIIEVDFAQLEFRAAVYLAGDVQGKEDIQERIDVHANTAKTLTAAGEATDRQAAKNHTFKPLYGGSSGTDAQRAYYSWFKERYHGVAEWQERNIKHVLKTGRLTLPTGREYDFPGTRRTPTGYVVNTTAICNYPVQGFATADLVPVTIIGVCRELRRRNLKSLLILTVHDSLEFDVYPGETKDVLALINDVFTDLPNDLSTRYDIALDVPMGWEVKHGPNWLDLKELHKGGLC